MTRPPAIMRFERLWWGSLATWLLATIIAWPRTQYQSVQTLDRLVRSQPSQAAADQMAKAAKVILIWSQPVTIAIVVLITLAVWFFAARRASGAVRWLAAVVAVLAGLRVAMLVIGSLAVGLPAPVTVGLFVLAAGLDLAAVAQLFGPEARAWFHPFDEGGLEIVE